MFHDPKAEVQVCSMSSHELLYWLGRGHKAFRHRGLIWLRLRTTRNRSSMVLVEEASVQHPMIKQQGVVYRLDPYMGELK